MKKIYNAPIANTIVLNSQDVITASNFSVQSSGDGMSINYSDLK